MPVFSLFADPEYSLLFFIAVFAAVILFNLLALREHGLHPVPFECVDVMASLSEFGNPELLAFFWQIIVEFCVLSCSKTINDLWFGGKGMLLRVVVVETYEMDVGVLVGSTKVYSQQAVAIGTRPVTCIHEFVTFDIAPPSYRNITVLRLVAHRNLGFTAIHSFLHGLDGCIKHPCGPFLIETVEH